MDSNVFVNEKGLNVETLSFVDQRIIDFSNFSSKGKALFYVTMLRLISILMKLTGDLYTF